MCQLFFLLLYRNYFSSKLYSNKIAKNRISLSLMEEILDVEEVGLTIYSTNNEIFNTLDELQFIPDISPRLAIISRFSP